MTGAKIIEGLKQALEGDLARVTIDGQTWVRAPAPSPDAPDDAFRLLAKIDVVQAYADAAHIASIHAHHAFWNGLLDYGWDEKTEKFGMALADAISKAIAAQAKKAGAALTRTAATSGPTTLPRTDDIQAWNDKAFPKATSAEAASCEECNGSGKNNYHQTWPGVAQCRYCLGTGIQSAAPAPSPDVNAVREADEDETYEIGVRDGYEKAVQDIDQLTGGDGEYRFCTDGDPERHTPGPVEMIKRIEERFAALASSAPVEVDGVRPAVEGTWNVWIDGKIASRGYEVRADADDAYAAMSRHDREGGAA
jgi:hypothetical protein